MKTLVISSLVSILFLVAGITFSQQESGKLRIGTFDSRCVALAYGRSPEFMKEVDSIKAAHNKAKEEGNNEVVTELEQLGSTKQVVMHQQVFSNGSINNILAKIKDKFPTLAKDNNVKMILSKWEIPFIDESFELVDITDQLVAMIGPDDTTKKIIDSIKAMVPIPIEQVPIDPMK